MHDLRDLMNEAVSGVTGPSESAVEADVTRGRRARARRTRRRMLVPAGAAAAVVAALAFSLSGVETGESGRPTISVALASYQGEQVKGFTVAKVPVGWEVLASTASSLVVAPQDASNQDPLEFEGKILVGVANEMEITADRGETHDLKIGGRTGTRFVYATDFVDGKSVYGPDASQGLLLTSGDKTLIFQFPNDLGWDDATIAEFAAGVKATGAAEPSGG